MTKNQSRFILVCLAGLSISMAAPAGAAPSQCQGSYFEDSRPDLVNPKLGVSAKELCSDYYAVWYSGVARSPLWAAEYLTRNRLEAAVSVGRTDDFRPDSRLPRDWQSTLADFKGSGLDRGHLAPSADMPTRGTDSQSFLLSNMIPQDPNLNRNLWAAVESAVRSYARYQPVYVITGPLFEGAQIKRLNGRVLIPTHVFKLVYDPKRNAAGAYLVENAPNRRHREITLAELEGMAGVRFLPSAVNVSPLKLPRPRY